MCNEIVQAVVTSSDAEQRAREVVRKMNLFEKITLLHGVEGIYVGNVKGNSRLNIPNMNMQVFERWTPLIKINTIRSRMDLKVFE